MTAHTAQAVEAYRRIEQALFTMQAMLEQENVQEARRPDLTALECVADKLEQVEDAWIRARQIADGDRWMEMARDEADTVSDVRYGGCQ